MSGTSGKVRSICGLIASRAHRSRGRLLVKESQHFWAFVAEYPSHFPTLPPGAEAQFIAAITQGVSHYRGMNIMREAHELLSAPSKSSASPG